MNLWLMTHRARTHLVFDGPAYWSAPRYTSVTQALDCVWIAATFACIAMERAHG